MEKLSNLNSKFEYLGKPMPKEFAEVCKNPRFEEKILKRKEDPIRYFKLVSNFLKYEYSGNLPKTVSGVVQALKYPDYIKDLFYMNEEGYKNVYSKEYADFFENQPKDEQERIFVASDFGARTLFEYMQDVECGSLIEKMISYHSGKILSQNEKASGGSGKISTYCDFIFKNPPKPGFDQIEVPVELKTKFAKKIEDDEVIKIRGSIRKIMETKGMILVVYVKLNKAVLIDPIGKSYKMEAGKMKNGKDCVDIHISKDNIVDFCFWDFESMKNMTHMIYDQYKNREK